MIPCKHTPFREWPLEVLIREGHFMERVHILFEHKYPDIIQYLQHNEY